MGDFRADVQIQLHLIDKDYKFDAWINWFPDGEGVDHRVMDFFREAWADAKSRYDINMERAYREAHAKEIQEAEKRELARLSAKYPTAAQPPDEVKDGK